MLVKGVTWALRISPHYYNTEAELDAMLSVLRF
jgi:selenocysteine lyase/cysteine desulfurase